ncbi:acyltransferase family protein [Limosilactobacillus reuteri]|uniref:Acyltransferase 3 domain-containing protein n=1 Tax=Limosilactobacillus reuteri TaxID=1598 RepID=A0ABD6XBB4_LIMRT|nr:acyltransferase family protein [Limosilactobacillus reuteri]PTM26759.1 hypothetical protein DA797_07180 [Limosilactobacillus reuteri]PTM26991.1 hypothetical protein DA796_09775 [Limosilactobacillus reuteri]
MKRDSKFELLRIISMAMIILSHYGIYGVKYGGISSQNLAFIKPMGEIGVGLFIMISAYFSTKKEMSVKNLINHFWKIYMRVVFYSWVILLCNIIFKFSSLNIKFTLKSVFPIIFNNYWFVTSFIFLTLLIPLLNKLINSTTSQQLIIIIIIIIIFSGIIPIFGQPFSPLGENLNASVMITEYLIIGYYCKYDIKITNFILTIVLLITIVGEFLTNIFTGFPSIIASAIIFFFILKIPSFYSRIINWIAASVFASYLITENVLIRIPFWKLVGNLKLPVDNIIKGVFITVMVILVTTLIDKIYILLNNLFISRITDKLRLKLIQTINDFLY